MKNRTVLAGFAAAVVLSACGGNAGSESTSPLASVLPDSMAGCYSTKQNQQPEFKIEKEGGQYFASFRKGDSWKREKEPLAVMSPEDLAKAFKNDAEKVDVALMYPKGAFAVFKFKSGASVEKKDPASDYMAAIFIGAGPVYRGECKS